MDASPITKYAILTRRTELRLHVNADVPPCDDIAEQSFSAIPGTLIKVYQSKTPSPISSSPWNMTSASSLIAGIKSSSSSNKVLCTVQVLDFEKHDPIFENLYDCPQANLRKVSESLWPYVISIAAHDRRLKILQSEEQCQRIICLKQNDLVSVNGELFGRNGKRYDCIIRYIGLVHELYPVGYFFGLELLHLDSGRSPQSEQIPFAVKYMECDPELSIFTTADWISQLPSEVKKKFSTLNLINDTLEKVRTAITPSTTELYNSTSLRKNKKSKNKEATSQFYEALPVPKKVEYTQQQDTAPEFGEMDRHLLQHQLNIMDSTDHSTSSKSIGNDEYTKSIENYDKNLERQRGNSSNSHIPNAQVPPAGILKHGRTSSASGPKDNSTSSSAATNTKPLNIMSLEDRDIIVIDKADIRESTKNEANVIVVDKIRQQDIDLADLLGNDWPNNAGDAASMLNKTKQVTGASSFSAAGGGGSSNSSVSSASQAKTDRNKSSNPLSHLSSSSLQRDKQQQKPSTDFPADAVSYSAVAALGNANENGAACLNKYINILHEDSSSPLYDNLNCDADVSMPTALSSAPAPDFNYAKNSPLLEIAGTGLGVGSMVEVSIPEALEDLYGVIRWIGVPPGVKHVMVGIELEDDQSDKLMLITDGSFNGVPLFKCPEGRALFVLPDNCANDRRFVETEGAVGGSVGGGKISRQDSKMFGQVECPSVAGAVAPLKIINQDQLEDICGKFKGIQGHHNSCYLDATLFSMFTFTSVFDSLLFRPPEPEDIANYSEVQKVLREEIVNPLRKNVFVRADRVMKLRKLLDKLSSVSGLTSEEKDPEEFLNSLLAQIMRVEPFLKLSSGQDAFFYQLFVEKDERLSFPTVQQLFEQSFHSSDIKLKEVPSCLIIQMPRFGKNYKMYPRILPSSTLDVTDIIEDSPRQCSVCGKLAEYECRDCFGVLQSGVGLESTAFCGKCLDTVHMHAKRANHSSKKLSVPQDFRIMAEHMSVPRLYMELFAVVCIETSHYVAFVKAGSGPDAPWCFFDSMADRKGEQNGYNIPEMITVPDLPLWLSEEGARTVNETSSNDKMLPEHAKRLFCDAYMCMYQSIDVMMYR